MVDTHVCRITWLAEGWSISQAFFAIFWVFPRDIVDRGSEGKLEQPRINFDSREISRMVRLEIRDCRIQLQMSKDTFCGVCLHSSNQSCKCHVYTPNLASVITVCVLEREHSRFTGAQPL